jgi:DNA-binding response OmpR family regulator
MRFRVYQVLAASIVVFAPLTKAILAATLATGLEAGMDDFLAKPLRMADLRRAMGG